MSTHPFGAAGFGFPPFAIPGWEQAAASWFQPFKTAAPAAAPQDPFAWWQPQAASAPAADPTALASQWLGQMQQLAGQFAGRDAAPAEIARAWRGLLGDNPFASGGAAAAFMPSALFGFAPGARGPLDLPAFGYAREHQERLQALGRAVTEFQQASQAFQAIVSEAGQDAFGRFESLLAKRAGEGKPVDSARGLFDVWIDAAEDAYADIALSERFQKAFGDYVNAQMRVRAGMQKEVELLCAQWGIPGREEVDAAYKRIAVLERELRRLRRDVERLSTAPAGPVAGKPADPQSVQSPKTPQPGATGKRAGTRTTPAAPAAGKKGKRG